MLYAKEMRPNFKNMRMTEQMKFIAERWNALNPVEKSDWQAKAELDKVRYLDEVNAVPLKPINPVLLQSVVNCNGSFKRIKG